MQLPSMETPDLFPIPDKDFMAQVAKERDLKVLEWAHVNGAPE